MSAADDAVQEAWLRLSRSDAKAIENLGGWPTTVVGRVCLDELRSRKSHKEEPLDTFVSDSSSTGENGTNPERETLLADSVGVALLVVLETLAPAERINDGSNLVKGHVEHVMQHERNYLIVIPADVRGISACASGDVV